MSVLYVMADGESVGKTMLCASLANNLIEDGYDVVVAKLHGDSNGDIQRYKEKFSFNVEQPISESVADAKILIEKYNGEDQIAIIEGSSEISAEEHAKFLSGVDASILIVTTADINKAEKVVPVAEKLSNKLKGVIINGVSMYQGTYVSEVLGPFYENANISVLGTVPEQRILLSLSVNQIADKLKGRFLSKNGDTESLVESFMGGGFGMVPGQYSFSTRTGKAVIVRGDRPDVQMSALQTDMNVFIMTCGLEPTEYVQYESAEEKVPIIVVDTNTLDTMESVSELQASAQFDHVKKLKHSSHIIKGNVEIIL